MLVFWVVILFCCVGMLFGGLIVCWLGWVGGLWVGLIGT